MIVHTCIYSVYLPTYHLSNPGIRFLYIRSFPPSKYTPDLYKVYIPTHLPFTKKADPEKGGVQESNSSFSSDSPFSSSSTSLRTVTFVTRDRSGEPAHSVTYDSYPVSSQSPVASRQTGNEMDTPAIPAPRDEGEKEVLEQLMSIRDHLQLRKLDRSTYVRTQDVMVLYEQTIEQVKRLNEIRNGKTTEENRGMSIALLSGL